MTSCRGSIFPEATRKFPFCHHTLVAGTLGFPDILVTPLPPNPPNPFQNFPSSGPSQSHCLILLLIVPSVTPSDFYSACTMADSAYLLSFPLLNMRTLFPFSSRFPLSTILPTCLTSSQVWPDQYRKAVLLCLVFRAQSCVNWTTVASLGNSCFL